MGRSTSFPKSVLPACDKVAIGNAQVNDEEGRLQEL